jgi:hypothetical protein
MEASEITRLDMNRREIASQHRPNSVDDANRGTLEDYDRLIVSGYGGVGLFSSQAKRALVESRLMKGVALSWEGKANMVEVFYRIHGETK